MDKKNKNSEITNHPRSWIIDVNMGYGHQRTAAPLKGLEKKKKVISANDYRGIPKKDRNIWERSRKFYEFVSKFKRIPLLGPLIWGIFDKFQKVLTFYPRRDLSSPNFQLKAIFSMIKDGWGNHLVSKLKKKPLSLITTFFTPAFMAEQHDFPNDICCVVCDADIARTWASLNPSDSKIKYFAPCDWVVGRLKLYGVKEKNIFLTGYPLPKENLGSENLEVLKHDLKHRLINLDPHRKYRLPYRPLIKNYLGALPQKADHPLTLMFAVGGAGAQTELAIKIVRNLKEEIKTKKIKLVLVAGIRKKVKRYFEDHIKKIGMGGSLEKEIEILFAPKIQQYFKKFNKKLRKTDILWTKPSELSFYAGLGLPIIVAPPIGSHESFNKKWLLRIGAAFSQKNPNYTREWLFDLIKEGRLAEAAMQGFMEIESRGTYNIEKIIKSLNQKK